MPCQVQRQRGLIHVEDLMSPGLKNRGFLAVENGTVPGVTDSMCDSTEVCGPSEDQGVCGESS